MTTSRRPLLAVLAICTLALALGRGDDGEPLARPHGDATYHYVYLPSLWLDGDLDLADQYEITGNPFRIPPTPTGRAGNPYGIGAAVLASPAFLVGHGLARISGARADGFSSVELALVAWASVLASVGAIGFAARLIARRLGDGRLAFSAALLTFAGGPVLFFAVRQPGLAHPFATLFTAWLIDAWDESYDRARTWRVWLRLGVLLGCAVLARPQLVTWGACLVVAGVADLRRDWRAFAPRLAIAALAAAACVLPQVVAWRVNQGSWLVVPQGDDFMRWDAPAWSEVLFSSRNGLFPWSPLYAIALVGLVAAARRAPRLVAVLLTGFAAQTVINGAVWDWWAGATLGARRFDSLYVAFAFGLGSALVACRTRVAAAWACALACVWLALANVVLVARTTPQQMRRYGGVSAASVLEDRLGPVLGGSVGWASSLSNLPARVAFAIRHGTDLAAYDQVVGVHWLGEMYPGLSARAAPVSDRRAVAELPPAFVEGLRGDVLVDGDGRVLIGLNRRGPVRVIVTSSAPEGTLGLSWNGGAWEHTSALEVARPARGVNTLALRGPPGCRVAWIELRAD